ncbi:uncharacterized protein LOC142350290 isoform X4 [Convolutriloba macropyga]|uniref:uncharacterized protein LOC142350290 isoform X4 n=1 Tax=Convolutriloba macropyga TaxID=536237 RepID=UPI003F5237B8
MFSSVAYEGLENFLKQDELTIFRPTKEQNSADSATFSLNSTNTNGYATAQSSPLLDSRIRVKPSPQQPRKGSSLIPRGEIPESAITNESTYEGVAAMSSFGRPLSRLSSTNTALLGGPPERKLSSFQSNDEPGGVAALGSTGRHSQSSMGSAARLMSIPPPPPLVNNNNNNNSVNSINNNNIGALRSSKRAGSNDNILMSSTGSPTATSRVNPANAPQGHHPTGLDFESTSATLGRRPLGAGGLATAPPSRSSFGNPSRISGASGHQNPNAMRQQSANLEEHHPGGPISNEMMLQFAAQNGIGTMYIPSTPGSATTPGDDRGGVPYVKGGPSDEFEMQSALNTPGSGGNGGMGAGSIIWPSNVTRGSGRGYAQNGVGTFQRNSIHDYQPLAPFQDGNGHMQTIGMVPGAQHHLGSSSSHHKSGTGVYEGAQPNVGPDGTDGGIMYSEGGGGSFCINWKCIITLMCVFTLLLLCLLSLIAIKFYLINSESLADFGGNDNHVIELEDFIGKSFDMSIPPKSSRMLSLFATGPCLLTLHIKTQSKRLLIYGLEGKEPHSTKFSFVHSLSASTPPFDSNRKAVFTSAFASEDMKTVYQYLSNGKWYIRIVNEEQSGYHIVDIQPKLEQGIRSKCEQECNYPQGECNAMGYCVCTQQYRGRLCEKPALNCGPHGRMVRVGTLRNGFSQACRCDPGWTGSLCDTSETGCYPPDCNGNGQCMFGTCQCRPGFSGETCNQTFCENRCSDRGVCVNNVCSCALGYSGQNCEIQSPDPTTCDRTCNHGDCVYGKCQCHKGFKGSSCSQPTCENNCNNNGQCLANENSEWYCSCRSGFVGPNCQLKLQPSCEDICNTNPACCKADGSCLPPENRPIGCEVGPSFANIDQSDSSEFNHRTSFLEKVSFLYNEQTDQRTLPFDLKERKFIFVVRGQVLMSESRPYLGATLSIKDHQFLGFARTQFNGWFDLMVATNETFLVLQVNFTGVDSGLSETKSIDFTSEKETFVTLLNPILVQSESARENSRSRRDVESSCDLEKLPKFVRTSPYFTHVTSFQNKFDEGAVISQNFATQRFKPDKSFPAMVFNSNSQGSKRITLYVGDFSNFDHVTFIHISISVAGIVFQETLDNTRTHLFHEILWNKTDVFGNKVFGLTNVAAKIEFSIKGCGQKFWVDSISTQVEGHSCHDTFSYEHHYCLTKGASLYTGRGHSFHTSLYPPILRHMQCLNPPKIVESLANGDLLIGDTTQIFHVRGNKIGNRCELNYAVYSFSLSSSEANDLEYYITSDPSPQSEFFYLSRSDSSVITKVFIKSRTEQIVLGRKGQWCDASDVTSCKDTLQAPKGMTILQNGTLVFVDGLSLRSWDPSSPDQDIRTLWSPKTPDFTTLHKTCSEIPLNEVFLPQLKDVFYSSIDDTFVLFDYSRAVVKLNLRTNRVSYVASRAKLNCKEMNPQSVARVYYPGSVTVTRQGDVFVADSDPLNKQTVVFKVSQNNIWSEFWHSDEMQIMSAMTVSNNETLLMVNNEERRVDILGRYEIIPENGGRQFQITDFENHRVVHFDENLLHVRSESVATTEFTDEFFKYYTDTSSLKQFVQRAAGVTLAKGTKAEFWNVQKGTKTHDYSTWQQSVWNSLTYNSDSLITRIDNSISVDRTLVIIDNQLVELVSTRMIAGSGSKEEPKLQSSCFVRPMQTGYSTMCTDGSNFGQFSSYRSYPNGKETLTLPDETTFTFHSALPGLSTEFTFSENNDVIYAIDYATKSRSNVYGVQLSSFSSTSGGRNEENHDVMNGDIIGDDVIMEKLFRSDRSIVTFGKKEPSLQFNLDTNSILPKEVRFQNGRSIQSHLLTFNSARQLTSIDTDKAESLFDAKYDSTLAVINNIQYKVDKDESQLKISLMGEENGNFKSLSLYSIGYDSEGSSFKLTSDADVHQSHSVLSLRDTNGIPKSSNFDLFSSKYTFKTLFNASTLTLTTYDGSDDLTTIKLDSSNRIREISYPDTIISVAYSPFSSAPVKFTKKVKEFTTMSYTGNTKYCNLTINRETGSKWLSSSFDRESRVLSVNLRQQWGASVEILSTYTPLTLKSSFLSTGSALLSLTFTDGKGLDLVQTYKKSEHGFNDVFGPNRFHETTFNYNDRELLKTKIEENEKDGTYSFTIRENNDDQQQKTHSYAVAINSVEDCGKVIHDPVMNDKLFFYEKCRMNMHIERDSQFQVIKEFFSDGRLNSITSTIQNTNIRQFPLKFNKNGFISKLGEKDFTYNSLGQLTKAETSEYSVEYTYDVTNRLVSRHITSRGGNSKSVDHAFFYLDPKNEDKMSHILVADKDASPKVYELYYDTRGQLVIIKEQENVFLVLSNPMGTVIELKGIDMESWISTSESFPPGLKFSLAGSWLDEEMGLVYVNKRFLDLETYTYLDLDTGFVQSAILEPYTSEFTSFINDPQSFWPKPKLSEIGAFETYMPELWHNETLQILVQQLNQLKTTDSTIQLIPSLSSFSQMFNQLFSTPLNANVPSISTLPFVQESQKPRNPALANRFILPPFNRVLDRKMNPS